MATATNQRLQYQPRARDKPLGTATEFEGGKYSTSGLSYPSDLLSPGNPYGNNFVVFYVNVHEDSLLTKLPGENYISPDKVNPRERGATAGSGIGTVGAAGGVIAGGAVAGVIADPVGRVGRAVGAPPLATPTGVAARLLKESIKPASNALIGGLAALAAIKVVGGVDKQYKRQEKAIALYVPNEMSIKYGANWEETSLATTLMAAQTVENAAKLQGTALVQDVAGYLAGQALRVPGAGEFLSKTSGVAMNPKKEQIFKSIDYRTFSFNYQFFPRSKKEAQDVRNIIKQFKLHMHPEFKPNTGQFLYLYPSEFDIYYYVNGKENMNIHRHTSCVLTDMSVVYSPQSQFTSFSDGMPSQINISLTFRELALLTKENILDGY